jgi:hypothetical protein
MLINGKNIKIMSNNSKFSFGHGYCLVIALLRMENKYNN